jgi:hypothetical protein
MFVKEQSGHFLKRNMFRSIEQEHVPDRNNSFGNRQQEKRKGQKRRYGGVNSNWPPFWSYLLGLGRHASRPFKVLRTVGY